MSATDVPQAREETPPPAPRHRGFLFWGCFMALLVLVVAGGGLAITVYAWVQRYTSTVPVPVPRYELKPGEAKAVEERLADFQAPASDGTPRQLVLTAGDLNALIAASPRGDRWAGKVFIRLEGEKAYADISLPLDEVPLLSGRYLNGTLELEVGRQKPKPGGKKRRVGAGKSKDAPEDEILRASVVGATAGGKPLPSEILMILKEGNLFESLSDEDVSGKTILEFARQAKSIEVKDGALILAR